MSKKKSRIITARSHATEVWDSLKIGDEVCINDIVDLVPSKVEVTASDKRQFSSFVCLEVKYGRAVRLKPAEITDESLALAQIDKKVAVYRKLSHRPGKKKKEKTSMPKTEIPASIKDVEFTPYQLGIAVLSYIESLHDLVVRKDDKILALTRDFNESTEKEKALNKQVKDQALKINELSNKLAKGEKTFSLQTLDDFRTSIPPNRS
jgi:hypothetical protein